MVVPRLGKNIGARLLNSVGRVHVIDPRLWSRALGTDYWASFGETSIDADTGGAKLDDFGWTTTTLTETAATGAGDFLSSDTPGVPDHVLTDGSTDLLQSPAIFGGYAHGLAVESMLGYAPTQLTLECYASFTVVTGTSNRSGFGLVEDAGTAGTAADELAWIYTDGTNFTIRSDAFEGQNFSGTVSEVSPALGPGRIAMRGPGRPSNANVLEVLVDISGASPLLPGMQIDVLFGANAPSTAAVRTRR